MSDNKTSISAEINKRIDNKRGRRVIMIATAVIVGLLVFKSIKPTMSQTSAAESKTTSITNTTTSTQAEIATLTPQLEKQKASNLTASLNAALPKFALADKQLTVLTKLADQTSVELPTFEPGQPDAQGSTYQMVPANLAIKGSLENCLRFLGGLNALVSFKGQDKLKAYGPVWQVSQMALAPGENGQVSVTLTSGYYIAGAALDKKAAQ